jgi:hypothetical protein
MSDDSNLLGGSEEYLFDLVRTYNVKCILNRQENSAMWDIITETFNKATGENATKKQLQKRVAYVMYKGKKKYMDSPNSPNSNSEDSSYNVNEQIRRADQARIQADKSFNQAEGVMKQRLEIEAQVEKVRAQNKEASARLCSLESQLL